MNQAEQIVEPILDGCARKEPPPFRLERKGRFGLLGLSVLDDMPLIQHHPALQKLESWLHC